MEGELYTVDQGIIAGIFRIIYVYPFRAIALGDIPAGKEDRSPAKGDRFPIKKNRSPIEKNRSLIKKDRLFAITHNRPPM